MHGLHCRRVRHFLAAGLLVLAPALAHAQSPTTVADIEIYQGTRKVAPKPVDPTTVPKVAAVVAATLQDATSSAIASTGTVIGRILDRSVPKWEAPRLPVVVNITLPQPSPAASPVMTAGGFQPVAVGGVGTPGLLPWAYANTARDATPATPREEPKPTVIIVREPAPVPVAAVAALPEPTGIRISNETLLLALGGVVIAAGVVLLRSRTPVAATATTVAKPAVPHATIRGFDVGPLPETMEKFDIGPSYAEEVAQNKADEKAGEAAVLQHILNQNLTMRAEMGSDN
ncbi:hypothetical protein [Limnoglobus roseus]|uniref:Uncharacterized protein n=1 Tax=Limnoglobus roseus TaxID=2598579 RepID=A0A5C1ABH8_9BACT|nr:hypothetical protein [Limnoglobus roseus]QEL14378.1 hypothetical protein PX52LOC_01266 [Limnoglobus roseus]